MIVTRRGPLSVSAGTVAASPSLLTASAGGFVGGDAGSEPSEQAEASRNVAARGSAANLQGRNMVAEPTVGAVGNLVSTSVDGMDDLTAKARFLFGLDEPPEDIEGFFVGEDLAGEDLFGPDHLDDAADLGDPADLDLDDLDLDDLEEGSTAAMRTVVASLILNDGPAVFWDTAQRLLGEGVDRRAALEQMAMALRTGLNAQSRDEIDQLPEFLTHGVADYFRDLPVPGEVAVIDAIGDVVGAEQGITLGPLVDKAAARLAREPGLLLPHVVADYIGDQLDEYGTLSILPDDRIVHLPSLVTSVVLTHRLSAVEVESDSMHLIARDLSMFATELDPRDPDGASLGPSQLGDDLAWDGPPGWLSSFRPGDLVGVRMDAEGVVTLEAVSDPPAAPGLADALRGAFDGLIEEDPRAVPGPMLLSVLLLDDPQAFALPRPPLTDLLASAGLWFEAGLVGGDAEHFAVAEADQRSMRMHEAVGGDCSIADVAIEAFDGLTDPDAPAADIRHALRDLGDGLLPDGPDDVKIRDLVVEELIPVDGRVADTDMLRGVAERVVAAARRSDEVAMAHWLAGLIAERHGELTVAEAEFHAAMAADAEFEAAVDRCAWYASDRGDAPTAARLWRSVDASMLDDLGTVERFARPTSARLGRNEPCWCGSGRKFKACHLGQQERVALPERVGWLWHKAAAYVLRHGGEAKNDLVANVLALAGASRSDFDPEALSRVARDPLPLDAMLTEGGWFARFLDARGALLPDDERLLAASWLLVDRSVHEVVSVEREVSIDLRDLRTGDVVTVTERRLGTEATPGMQFCARVVPDGTGHQVVGAMIPLRVGDEQAAMAICERADPIELCEWAGARHRPPTRLADLAGTAAMPDEALGL